MPSSAHDRARSAKAWAGERKTGPETASGQDLEAVRMRVARSSEGMTAMVEGASRAHRRAREARPERHVDAVALRIPTARFEMQTQTVRGGRAPGDLGTPSVRLG